MDAPPNQYVTTSDGYNIAYSVQGQGDPWLIVPPGFHHLRLVLEEEEMAGWVAGLSERYRLIRYDSRGQGLSSRGLRDPLSMDTYLLDLEAVFDRLNPGPVILHGIGSSAHIAVRFAARNPQRVRALVLAQCSLTSEPWPRALMDLVAQADWDIFLRTMTGTRRSSPDARLSMERLRQMVDQNDFVKKYHAYQASDISDLCQQIERPTLVFHLREINRPSLQQAAELAARIPGAHLAEIDGGFPPWMWGSFDSAIPIIEDFLAGIPAEPSEMPASTPAGLSHRESEVLRLLAAGRSNQEIADELVISLNTVRRHVSNIFDKTGVANRAQATAFAKDHGVA